MDIALHGREHLSIEASAIAADATSPNQWQHRLECMSVTRCRFYTRDRMKVDARSTIHRPRAQQFGVALRLADLMRASLASRGRAESELELQMRRSLREIELPTVDAADATFKRLYAANFEFSGTDHLFQVTALVSLQLGTKRQAPQVARCRDFRDDDQGRGQ